jgi:hypothetical protein
MGWVVPLRPKDRKSRCYAVNPICTSFGSCYHRLVWQQQGYPYSWIILNTHHFCQSYITTFCTRDVRVVSAYLHYLPIQFSTLAQAGAPPSTQRLRSLSRWGWGQFSLNFRRLCRRCHAVGTRGTSLSHVAHGRQSGHPPGCIYGGGRPVKCAALQVQANWEIKSMETEELCMSSNFGNL